MNRARKYISIIVLSAFVFALHGHLSRSIQENDKSDSNEVSYSYSSHHNDQYFSKPGTGNPVIGSQKSQASSSIKTGDEGISIRHQIELTIQLAERQINRQITGVLNNIFQSILYPFHGFW